MSASEKSSVRIIDCLQKEFNVWRTYRYLWNSIQAGPDSGLEFTARLNGLKLMNSIIKEYKIAVCKRGSTSITTTGTFFRKHLWCHFLQVWGIDRLWLTHWSRMEPAISGSMFKSGSRVCHSYRVHKKKFLTVADTLPEILAQYIMFLPIKNIIAIVHSINLRSGLPCLNGKTS